MLQMLELKDFFDDQMILRQVKRQAAQAAAEMDDLGDAEDDVPVSMQRKMPDEASINFNDHTAEDRRRTTKPERVGWSPIQEHVASTPEFEDGDPEPIE